MTTCIPTDVHLGAMIEALFDYQAEQRNEVIEHNAETADTLLRFAQQIRRETIEGMAEELREALVAPRGLVLAIAEATGAYTRGK